MFEWSNRTFMTAALFALVIVVFGIAKLWTLGVDVPKWLAGTDIKVEWPGLYGNLLTASGDPSTGAIYTLPWLSNPGTLLLFSGIVVGLVYTVFSGGGRFPMTVRLTLSTFPGTLWKMRLSVATVATVLGLAYVMNHSGQTVAIGTWLAGTGAIFALLSPQRAFKGQEKLK